MHQATANSILKFLICNTLIIMLCLMVASLVEINCNNAVPHDYYDYVDAYNQMMC